MQTESDERVTRLLPAPALTLQLQGLYLKHNIRSQSEERGKPYVYANFVTSLDGRIAIPDEELGGLKVPSAIANPRDWRLFQELAIQADVILTTGRYLRDYAAGKAQEILRVYDDPAFADLVDWRRQRGLSPMPDLAVISGSLDFPIPPALREQERRVIVATHARADSVRMHRMKQSVDEVLIAGAERVHGSALVEALSAYGYQTIYSAAGPRILHMLLADDALDRLYLTTVMRFLGGRPFATIVDGSIFDPPVDMSLHSLYLDGNGDQAQLFACYDRQPA